MAGEHKSGGVVRWVLWFILGEFVLIAVLTPMLGKGAIEWLVRTEREMSLSQIGFDATLWVEKTGWRMYAALFRDTSIEKAVYEFFIPNQEQLKDSRGMEALGANLYFPMVQAGLDSLFSSCQRFLVRLSMIALWLPAVPIVLIPAIWDGMLSWRRKQYSFDYPSPLVHGWSARVALWLTFGTPFALMLPVPIPPLVFPFLFILLAFALMLLASHTMKRI